MEEKNYIYVNKEQYEIATLDYDKSLLDWIRTNINLKGTKEGCNEGDCGACSVIITDQREKKIKAINSCLVRLGQIINYNIFTIEGLSENNNLNSIQESFIKNHASQCGFCTPGFIISGTALLMNKNDIKEEDIHDCLSGNLCRCTGYSPIIKSFHEAKGKKIKPFIPLKTKYVNKIKVGNTKYYHPQNLNELKKIIQELREFKFLSGGTDLNLIRPYIKENEENIISLKNVNELNKIEVSKSKIKLGSCVSIEDFLNVAKNKLPQIVDLLKRFGSPLIRNQASIGGNLCTSSPIGDLAPIFLVLDSELTLNNGKEINKINLEKFFKGYRQNVLNKKSFLQSISFLLPKKDYQFFSWKFSKRYDQDISTVSIAILIKVKNSLISDIKIAAGGVFEKPILLKNLSNFLINKNVNTLLSNLENKLQKDISPISDFRGTSEYRNQVMNNSFTKLYRLLSNNSEINNIMEVGHG